MKDYAYLHTKPTEIKFSLNYSDNSGERISISLTSKQKDILIKDGISNDGSLVSVDYLDWLIQTLQDVKQIVQFSNKEQNPERSVAHQIVQ
jgi:hypothetical protein